MQTRSVPRTRFLGWDTVIGGAGLQLLQSAIFYQSFGVFVVAWTADFGWSSTAVSGGYALVTLQGALLGPVQGWLLERFGVRRIILVGLIALCGGLGMLSLVSTLTAYYVAMFVTGIGLALAGFLSITTGVVPWFARRRSTALSLMAVGISLGGLLVPLVATATVDIGWRATLQVSALTMLLAGLPLAVLMRREPAAYGQVADGASARPPLPAGHARGLGERAPDGDFTLAQALRTRTFWLLGAAHGAAMLVVSAVTVHLIPHLSGGAGYSLQGAAGIVALVTVVTGVGQLIGGPLGDRFDKRVIAALAMLAHAVAMLVLAWGQGVVAVWLFALVHGLAWGIRGPLMGSIRADYFGIRHFGSIMGVSSLVFMAGALVGPVLAGTLADTLGDYRLGFTVMAVIAASSSVVFWWARPPAPPATP